MGVHPGKRSLRLEMHLDYKKLQRSRLLQGKLVSRVPDCQNHQQTPKWQLSFASEKTTHGIYSINLGFCFIFQRYCDTVVNKKKKNNGACITNVRGQALNK